MALRDAAQAVHLDLVATTRDGADTLLLLAPFEPGFWGAFTSSAEYADGEPDPMDRWSKRVIGALALEWGGSAIFPSDGPPYPPFISWALASEQVWTSPIGLLVHPDQGLWLSFRGAIRLPGDHMLAPRALPCETCADRPCATACPVDALTPDGYDTVACHAYLDTDEGQECLKKGCAARRACPVSMLYGRKHDQSLFHMRAFHTA